MKKLKKIAVFISGRGTNLNALLEHQNYEDCSYEVVLVVSDNLDANGLQYARQANIPIIILDNIQRAREWVKNNSSYSLRQKAAYVKHTMEKWEDDVLNCMEIHKIDYIILAGFMTILTPKICTQWAGRILNIHPSLLPKYPGLNTHERCLENEDTHHGLSIHFVDSGIDTGPVIFQVNADISDIKDVDVLKNYILYYENWYYPLIVDKVCSDEIYWNNGDVHMGQSKLKEPLTVHVE